MVKRLSEKVFREIYSKVPRLCVDLIIKNKKEIIFTKRKIIPWKGMWHLPGGTVMFNEKIEDTIRRVAKREVNLDVKIVKFLGIQEWFVKKQLTHTVSLVYLCEILKGNLKVNEEAYEARFFNEVPENTIEEHILWLKKFIK